MIIAALVAGLVLGFILGFYYVLIIQEKAIQKVQRKIENVFADILKNQKKLKFEKRINKYVYLFYNNWEVIYQLDSKVISIFEDDNCIYTSTQISDSKVVNEITDYIENKFNKTINDIVIINNVIYSSNIIKNQWDSNMNELEEMESYTVDDLLDKINEVGYENLTSEEKEFLKNCSK